MRTWLQKASDMRPDVRLWAPKWVSFQKAHQGFPLNVTEIQIFAKINESEQAARQKHFKLLIYNMHTDSNIRAEYKLSGSSFDTQHHKHLIARPGFDVRLLLLLHTVRGCHLVVKSGNFFFSFLFCKGGGCWGCNYKMAFMSNICSKRQRSTSCLMPEPDCVSEG